MVIVMGLKSNSVQKLEEAWQVSMHEGKGRRTLDFFFCGRRAGEELISYLLTICLLLQSMPSRDLATMKSLEKLLDVSGNMRPYRTAFSSAKAPAIPFFPIVLKDLTFFVEGNKTYLEDSSSTDAANNYSSLKDARRQSPNELSLINFAKFRTVTRFVTSMLALTSENYPFAGLLETTPFFNLTAGFGAPTEATDMNTSKCIGPLDLLAQTIERRIQVVPTSHTSS
jgi:RasGEF domain